MTFQIIPIKDGLGAEVRGIDLTRLVNADTQRLLHDAWIEHAVLIFPDQKMTPEQFSAAAELFGDIMPQQLAKFTLANTPGVGVISSEDLPRDPDGRLRVRGENFHTDHSNYEAPPKATMLYAVTIPTSGGDTQFVDTRRAFDDLPEGRRRKLVELRCPHVYESANSPRKMFALTAEELAKTPSTVQPLVIRHPESGRSALYLNTGRMDALEGMEPDKAFALIDELYEHATQTKYEYRHRWHNGDFVIWDNRSVMHQANADFDPETEKRFLYRIMLKGAPLQAAA